MITFNRERLERLRSAAIRPAYDKDAGWYLFFDRYAQNEYLVSPEARYADAYDAMIDGLTPVIDEDELIVGKPFHYLIIAHLGSVEHVDAIQNAANGNIFTDTYSCEFRRGRSEFSPISSEDRQKIPALSNLF